MGTKKGVRSLIWGCIVLPLFLTGCGMAPVGAYNGFSNDPMTKIVVVKFPAPGGTKYPTRREWKVIKQMADTCQLQIAPQLSSPAETVGSSAAVYGLAGGAGIGLGALAFPGAIFHRYFQYGGTAGALSGAAYGLTLWSYNDVSIVGSCTRDFVRRSGLKDIYVYPAYIRTKHSAKQVSPEEPAPQESHAELAPQQDNSKTVLLAPKSGAKKHAVKKPSSEEESAGYMPPPVL